MGRKPAGVSMPEERKQRFLEALRKAPHITAAARAAGWHRSWAYRERAADPEFAAAWDDALEEAIDLCEEEAHRRAFKGTVRPVFQGGVRVGSVREYSDTLAIFMLKAHRPERYRENVRMEHAGRLDIRNVTELSDDELAHIAAGGGAGAAAPEGGA